MQNTDFDCPHCNIHSFALTHPLYESVLFRVVCDVHPLTRGHILLMPKIHLSCIGDYPDNYQVEFLSLYQRIKKFIRNTYGSVSSFEHGIIGQTVFHSHVQIFPYTGNPESIIPENNVLKQISGIKDLKTIYASSGKYLYFSIGNSQWIVNNSLGYPGFFRDRFSNAFGHPERGNWRMMRENNKIMQLAERDIEELEQLWRKNNSYDT